MRRKRSIGSASRPSSGNESLPDRPFSIGNRHPQDWRNRWADMAGEKRTRVHLDDRRGMPTRFI